MNISLSRANLDAGIKAWRGKPSFDQDFRDCLYKTLAGWKTGGLIEGWWTRIADELCRWRANRPKTKSFIHDRGFARLADLLQEYARILARISQKICHWRRRHGSRSPLSSKSPGRSKASPAPSLPASSATSSCRTLSSSTITLCSARLGSYADYWNNCRSAWTACDEKQERARILRSAIDHSVAAHYPWSTKLTELRMIGARARPRPSPV